jgi:hypothetical protein
LKSKEHATYHFAVVQLIPKGHFGQVEFAEDEFPSQSIPFALFFGLAQQKRKSV